MASFVRNSIWARVCPGDLVYDIEFESLLLTHIAFSGKLLSASSSVTIHFVADSGEKRIWDVGTLLAHEREHIEVYFPFFSNKVYSVHVQGPSDICLAGVNLSKCWDQRVDQILCKVWGRPPSSTPSSIVTKEVSTVPQEATAARKRVGKKRAITVAARVPSLRKLKAGKVGWPLDFPLFY
ncbi:hypothetical protein CCMSSC00406_0006679 [Pleurotus cornucopiae]|uniref:Uncharacterized protein n=1 Tax=Pleurotus cornucopiae TaxID=5321 RepID=A0ACB7IXW7_PLECO|nr:hypothetical protein CCMSSC00406_0006679 [Pleurotus cornucopiae]